MILSNFVYYYGFIFQWVDKLSRNRIMTNAWGTLLNVFCAVTWTFEGNIYEIQRVLIFVQIISITT